MASDISVIICAHSEERWETLREAVASVKQQTLPAREIIVVIDHNTALLQRVRESIPDIVVVENTGTRGLSGARNSGIAVARGQILVFLDDDALTTPNWLSLLSSRYDEAHVLGVGGAIIPLWSRSKPHWFPEEFYWVVGCTYRGMPQSDSAVRNLIGANMSLRREVFAAVGGFRSDIGRVGSRPVGCEETELCIRASQHWPHGIFRYHPEALVFHHVPGRRASWRYFCARCYAEGLSKALVSRCVGRKDSLASERSYALQVLPAGMVRGCGDALFHRDLAGFARAAAISIGLGLTATGYLLGTLLLESSRWRAVRAIRGALQHRSFASSALDLPL